MEKDLLEWKKEEETSALLQLGGLLTAATGGKVLKQKNSHQFSSKRLNLSLIGWIAELYSALC